MKISQEGTPTVDCMQTIKGIMDALALVAHILSDAKIMAYTLNGLIKNFKELTTTICVQDIVMTFEELHDKLLDHETFLK